MSSPNDFPVLLHTPLFFVCRKQRAVLYNLNHLMLGELLAAGIAVGESDEEWCWLWAMEESVGFKEGLSVGELDDKVLAMGELVGNNKSG